MNLSTSTREAFLDNSTLYSKIEIILAKHVTPMGLVICLSQNQITIQVYIHTNISTISCVVHWSLQKLTAVIEIRSGGHYLTVLPQSMLQFRCLKYMTKGAVNWVLFMVCSYIFQLFTVNMMDRKVTVLTIKLPQCKRGSLNTFF